MKSEIILKAKADLKDNEAREVISKMWVKIETLNERTKRQTIQIRELNKKCSQ